MKEKVLSAAIYTRISSDPRGEGLGVARQLDDCRELIEVRGYQVFGIYEDNDVSAFSGKHRPEYSRMMADVSAGRIDVVVTWDADRLHRNPSELEDFISVVEEADCKVETVRSGLYDLTTDDGRFVARIVGAVARKESEQKSARLRRKHLEIAKEGKISGGGTRPFGFTKDRMTIVEAEAVLIRDAAERVMAGMTLGGIVKDWDRKGIRTSTGKSWRPVTLRRMLTSARIAGIRELRDEVETDAVWPAIISKAELIRLRKILLDPQRRRNHGSTRYLLTGGLVTCGLCGSNLVARPRGDKKRCYVCASDPGIGGCGKIRSLAEPLEAAVVEMIFLALDDEAFTSLLLFRGENVNEVAASALQELHDAKDELSDVDEMLGAGEISRSSYVEVSRKIKKRIEAAESRIPSSPNSDALRLIGGGVSSLRESWENLPIESQRAIVFLLIEEIPVMPAVKGRNFFDASRIGVPKWRQ
jgi:site-specific DNA recombinase